MEKITLSTWQEVTSQPEYEVSSWGDYDPQDLVLCNRKGEDEPIVQFQAHYITTGENYIPPSE